MQRIVTEDTTPIPGARIVGEISLQPHGGSTTVTVTCSRGRGPWLSRSVNNLVARRLMGPRLRKGLTALRERIEGEIADGSLLIPERRERVAADIDPSAVTSTHDQSRTKQRLNPGDGSPRGHAPTLSGSRTSARTTLPQDSLNDRQ